MASTTLSRGYKSPNNPDTGNIWFPDITTDIQQLNDHTHNGADGAPLGKTQSIAAGSWVANGTSGQYKQTVTLPTYTNGAINYQLKFDEIHVQIRVTGTLEMAWPKIVKNGTNSFDVYTNDNTVAFTAIYI